MRSLEEFNMWARICVGVGCAGLAVMSAGCSGDSSPAGGVVTHDGGSGGASDATRGAAGDDSSGGAGEGWSDGAIGGEAGPCPLGSAPSTSSGTCEPLVRSSENWAHLGDVVAAARAKDAGLLYVDAEGGAFRMLFQLIDDAGRPLGEPVTLRTARESVRSIGIGLASDGTRYLACMSEMNDTQCLFLAPGSPPVQAYHVVGNAPSLAYGHGEWLVAYGVDGGQALQLLGADGAEIGSPVLFPDSISGLTPKIPLAATPEGFVAVMGATEKIYRLDPELQLIGTPLDLGVGFWTYGSVAATESMIAVNLSVPYGSLLAWGGLSGSITKVAMSGGGKLGLPIDLLASGHGISAAWDDSGTLSFEADVRSVLPNAEASSESDSLATVRIGAQTLVADVAGGFTLRVRRMP